jgi:hypothetical protein
MTQELKDKIKQESVLAVLVRAPNALGYKEIHPDDCSLLKFDEEGGLWYREDLNKSPIPIFTPLIYVAPAGIIQIAFN